MKSINPPEPSLLIPVVKKYGTLEELRQGLLNKKIGGILLDSYVSDSRRELFSDFSIKQVIDLRSSYGVVMGENATKIRKCVNKYWRENAAMRANFIKENTKPVEVSCGLRRQPVFNSLSLG